MERRTKPIAQFDWFVDVLADLAEFAKHNEMPETAVALKEVKLIVQRESARPKITIKPVPAQGDNFVLFSDFDNPDN